MVNSDKQERSRIVQLITLYYSQVIIQSNLTNVQVQSLDNTPLKNFMPVILFQLILSLKVFIELNYKIRTLKIQLVQKNF